MNETEIKEAFSLLRDLCDPRGHSLLAVLESTLLTESALLDGFVNMGKLTEDRSNVVPMIAPYSRKVEA